MSGQILLVTQRSGAFEHQVDAQFGPRQLTRIPAGMHGYRPVANHQVIPVDADRSVVATVHTVVAQQVGQIARRHEVIDRREVHPVDVEQDLQRCPTDASQTVDGHRRHRSTAFLGADRAIPPLSSSRTCLCGSH